MPVTSAAAQSIRQAIRESGTITFAEFMDAALYGPDGYYSRRSRVGAEGDYFTAPHAHPAFGALIAVQMKRYWDALGRPREFTAVEMGAGDGLLASDVTAYARRLDAGFASSLRYLAFDRAVPPAPAYPVTAFAPPDVAGDGGHAGEAALGPRLPSGIMGCVISNELLDAMPVHRFVIAGGQVRELFVALDGDRFIETPGAPASPEIGERVGPFAASLPEGFKSEVNTGIGPWAGQVSKILDRGFVMTFDYGHDRAALYSAERRAGTLRTYYRHTLGQDPFRRVGEQDMTAHVDFTAVDEAMTSMGFDRRAYASQRDFLNGLGLKDMIERLRAAGLPQAETDTDRAGMLELVKPEGMGGFRVAVHGRGVPAGGIAGVTDTGGDDPMKLPLPLLRDFKLRPGVSAATRTGTGSLPSWEELFSDR